MSHHTSAVLCKIYSEILKKNNHLTEIISHTPVSKMAILNVVHNSVVNNESCLF